MTSARLLALLLAAITTLAACSGGGSDGAAEPTGSAGPSAIPIGFINMEGSPAGSFPEATAGAEAAISYVNEELGGVDGRSLKLSVCRTNGTPESSQSCAQRLVAARPVAVIGGVDLGAEASVPVITTGGIPYVTGSPTLIGEMRNDGAYAFTGGVAGDLLAIGQYLVKERRVRSIHVLHADLPGLLNSAVSAARDVFRARNVQDVKLVTEKVDAADFAPALTAATAGNPDALVVVFPAQSCSRILQAAASLGVRTQMYFPGACAAPAVVKGADAVLDRTTFASAYLPVPAQGGSAEEQAFRAGVREDQRSPISQAAFSSVLNLHALLGKSGTTDAAAVRAALASAVDAPNVFAHPYTCDGKQIALLPSVCNTSVRLLTYSGGAFTDVSGDWVDGSELSRVIGGG